MFFDIFEKKVIEKSFFNCERVEEYIIFQFN